MHGFCFDDDNNDDDDYAGDDNNDVNAFNLLLLNCMQFA